VTKTSSVALFTFLLFDLQSGSATTVQDPIATEIAKLPGRAITLPELLALAEQHSPALRVAAAGVNKADAGIVSARAYRNPSITFGSLGRQQVLMSNAAYSGMLHGLSISQPFELPMLRSARIRAATVQRQTREAALAETRLLVRGSVKQAFYEALRRKREVDVVTGNVRLLEDLRRRIQVQVEVGEAARLELTRAEAEVASARIAVRSAELRFSAALSDLYAVVGVPLGDINPEGELAPVQILPPLPELKNEALTRHPTISRAELDVRYSDASLEHQRAKRWPQPTFWVDYFKQPEAAQWRYGLSLDIPLWNKQEGPIAEAGAERAEAAAVVEREKVQLLAAVEQAYRMYEVANQQVQISEAGTLRQAEAAVRAAEAAFKFGERGILEVLDAQRVLRAARLDYLNAQFDRQQALVDLEQLRTIDLGDTKP
jgi:cobalt-zinc-cadmium efflux system outer membrane protein